MRLVLDIDKMDVGNFTETWGYGLLFFAEADRLGLFLNPKADTRQKAAILNVSGIWLSKIEHALAKMNPGEAFEMLTMFDFLHRIVHRRPVSETFRNKYILNAFRAMSQGDESVNKYDLFGAISNRIRRNDRQFCGEPLLWQENEINRWFDDFNDDSITDGLPMYDRLQRATTILRADLKRFEIKYEDVFKASVKRRNRHLLDDLTDSGTRRYGFRTYYALDQFLSEFRTEFNQEKITDYEVKVHSAIISSSDIDIYTKTYYEDYQSRYIGMPTVARIDLSKNELYFN